MQKNKVPSIIAGLLLLSLTACGALKPKAGPTQPAEGPVPTTGVRYHFVTNKLLLPTTQAQTQAVALNLDGDAKQHPDNVFGELLTLLSSAAPGLDLQSTLDQAVNAGQLVTLHMVKADDPLNDSSVSWTLFEGAATNSPPRFDGSDTFTLDPTPPANAPIVGSLSSGHFSGGPGTARLQMNLLGRSVDVGLIGVRLEADLSATGCANGKLGGGMTVDEFRSKLLPAIAAGLNEVAAADKALAGTLLQAVDLDRDGTITSQELEGNSVLMMAIRPDLDLLDSSGKFSPGQDGVKDSYSMGLGFSCVPATFSAPGE